MHTERGGHSGRATNDHTLGAYVAVGAAICSFLPMPYHTRESSMNGAIIYEGPSLLNGRPIAVVVTGLRSRSQNPKTGDMLQTWILPREENPVDAVKSGDDASVCGSCPHRPTLGGSCYVNVFQAPRSVWVTLSAGRYPNVDAPDDIAALGAGRAVRVGSWGDPAAVPTRVWDALISRARTWTGYTHQWRAADAALAWICMASVDTPDERAQAQAAGWRTFRVRTPSEAPERDEVTCPASAEAGHKSTCAKCGLCKGAASRARKDVVIAAHGSGARKFERARQFVAFT